MIDSVIGDNIPILTEQEKFNETITSSVKRIGAALTGKLPFSDSTLTALLIPCCPIKFSSRLCQESFKSLNAVDDLLGYIYIQVSRQQHSNS